jgi:DNA polymerase-3 subunit delta'
MWRTIGQPNAMALLERSIRANTLSHAYLFVGPPHVGKTTLAVDFAQALNCAGTEPPCGKCRSCLRILEGKHSDIETICLGQDNFNKSQVESSVRTKIGIVEIQELQHHASLPPFEGKKKIFIIDGAENLSIEAANCILKILEEPPPNVIWILLVTEENKILPTILSRCQRLELKPASATEIEKILVSNFGFENDKARLLSRLSGGCIGRPLSVANDEEFLQQRSEKLISLFPLLGEGIEKRFDYIARLGKDRKAANEAINFLLTWWHDLMLLKCNCCQYIANIDCMLKIEEWAQNLDIIEINNFIDALQSSLDQISRNANMHLVLEVLMLNMPRKEGTRHNNVAAPLIE